MGFISLAEGVEAYKPKKRRTPSEQVTYRTLYVLARDYIVMDKNAKYRDDNPYKAAELANILLDLANKADWKCQYTEHSLNLKNRDIWKVSFDRIDNSIPHIPENMVITAKWLNCVRSNTPYDQWVEERQWEQVYCPKA